MRTSSEPGPRPVAIRAEGLGKRYRIAAVAERHDTLRERISASLSGLAGRIARRHRDMLGTEELWALRDVSFEIGAGDVVGVIGRNGAGKSTLLKILTRVTKPTEGRAEIRGRVGSLLEVGTGFHPELSGRENIYLSGTVLGMSRREVDDRFESIVDFSGIRKFIDTPVKRYSSGMTVRLGFAIAAHLEPEVLLIDEVLAVGDVSFQRRCLGKMDEVSRSGRTVMFVSHNMGAIHALCPRCMLIEEGRLAMFGETEEVISAYLAGAREMDGHAELEPEEGPAALQSVSVLDPAGVCTSALDVRRPVTVRIRYRIDEPIRGLISSFNVYSRYGSKVFTSRNEAMETTHDGCAAPGSWEATAEIPAHLLAPGVYYLSVGLHIPRVHTYDVRNNILGFTVIESGSSEYEWAGQDLGVVLVEPRWSVREV